MSTIVIRNALEVLTCRPMNSGKPKTRQDLSNLREIRNGAVVIEDGRIAFVGKDSDVTQTGVKPENIIDARGKLVMPGFVDCHTHAVFAGSRADEWKEKLTGVPYADILRRGGGILNTVCKTREASIEELLSTAEKWLKTMLEHGTTTVEIKSGYGLTPEDEIKMLKVAGMLAEKVPLDIVRTYLGAHAVPKGKSKEEYIEEVLESLEQVRQYAEFCDIFCEGVAFNIDETREILTCAKELGFKLKIHSEQLSTLDSPCLAAELGAVSVDHLEHISERGIQALARSGVMGVLLPGATFFLRGKQYAPAEKMIREGVALAIATDFNPGSCPCPNLQYMLTLACLQMGMSPAQVINAATINAASAIGRADKVGSLEVGKEGDVVIFDVPDHRQLPYWFGTNRIEQVIKHGKVVFDRKEAS